MSFKKIIIFIFNQLNIRLSIYIFKNHNLFTYNIFSFFYKLNISNKIYNKKIFENSFGKLGTLDNEIVQEINKDLELQRNTIDRKILRYEINNNIQLIIKKIINEKLNQHLSDIENYYNARLSLAWAGITRNHPVEDHKKEMYSNFYHNDAYTFNLFKVFINLHNVDLSNGPLHVIKKHKSKDFINFHKYKSRNNYIKNLKTPDEYVYINTGNTGDIFFCNTTELFHKAGEPTKGNTRDMLFLNFVAIPNNLDESNYFFLEEQGHNIFDKNASVPKIFAKPEGLNNLIKLYKKFKKNRIN